MCRVSGINSGTMQHEHSCTSATQSIIVTPGRRWGWCCYFYCCCLIWQGFKRFACDGESCRFTKVAQMKNCWPQWTFCMRTWSCFASCWCCEWGCCSCAPLALSGTQPGRSNGNSASTSCLAVSPFVSLSGYPSVRLYSSAFLLSADIIWGHAYPNVCRIFTAIVSNFMAQVVINFVRAV